MTSKNARVEARRLLDICQANIRDHYTVRAIQRKLAMAEGIVRLAMLNEGIIDSIDAPIKIADEDAARIIEVQLALNQYKRTK